jgi:undecaprenyl pyrophosphate phosphatase UppP
VNEPSDAATPATEHKFRQWCDEHPESFVAWHFDRQFWRATYAGVLATIIFALLAYIVAIIAGYVTPDRSAFIVFSVVLGAPIWLLIGGTVIAYVNTLRRHQDRKAQSEALKWIAGSIVVSTFAPGIT